MRNKALIILIILLSSVLTACETTSIKIVNPSSEHYLWNQTS